MPLSNKSANEARIALLKAAPDCEWREVIAAACEAMADEGLSLDRMKEQFMCECVLWALRRTDYNQSRAARLLKAHRNTLMRVVSILEGHITRLGCIKNLREAE